MSVSGACDHSNHIAFSLFPFQLVLALFIVIVPHYWWLLASRSWGCVWGSTLWRFGPVLSFSLCCYWPYYSYVFWVCFLHEWLDRRWQCVLSWAWVCFSLSEVFTCICWCLWDRRTGSSTTSRYFNCFQIVYWISFLTRAVVAFITQSIITRKRNVTAGIFVWPLSLPGKCLWHDFRVRLCRTFLFRRLWRDNSL